MSYSHFLEQEDGMHVVQMVHIGEETGEIEEQRFRHRACREIDELDGAVAFHDEESICDAWLGADRDGRCERKRAECVLNSIRQVGGKCQRRVCLALELRLHARKQFQHDQCAQQNTLPPTARFHRLTPSLRSTKQHK